MDIDDKFVDDPVKVCLDEVCKVPPLSREEEIRCIQHIRAGDDQAEAEGNAWPKPIYTWLCQSPNDIETIAFTF